MIDINKTYIAGFIVDDFRKDFTVDGITYKGLTPTNFRQFVYSINKKGPYIFEYPKHTIPRVYYTKEYKHSLTPDIIGIENQAQNTNASLTFLPHTTTEPKDTAELIDFGIHNILFNIRVKDSHQIFLTHGLIENSKKIIQVGKFAFKSLKFKVNSTSKDTLIVHVANSRNQILLGSPQHMKLFDDSLDYLIDQIATHYNLYTIPHHNNWIIKQWHYGADYYDASQEKFHVTFKDLRGIFARRYSKLIASQGTNTRIETQEQSNLTKKLAIATKIGKIQIEKIVPVATNNMLL
jgi:hypothetical protein